MLYVPCLGNSFIQACNIITNPDTMHASIFLTNRRQQRTIEQKSHLLAAKSEPHLLHDWLLAAVLQLACSDQWPQPGPGKIKPESEPEVGGEERTASSPGHQEPAPVTREQSGAGTQRIMTSSSHVLEDSLWSSWVYCERENNKCHGVMQQTRTKNAEIF